jgi:hypothetical protein
MGSRPDGLGSSGESECADLGGGHRPSQGLSYEHEKEVGIDA